MAEALYPSSLGSGTEEKLMSINPFDTKHSTTVYSTVCAIVFCLFTFVYLYFYQADILSMAQHVLSGGVTQYNRWVGAVLITLVLQLVQTGVYALTGLREGRHALTYFPSVLILGIISSASTRMDVSFSFGVWTWLLPLLLLVWGFGLYAALKIPYGHPSSKGVLSGSMWVNVMSLCAMFFFVGLVGNSNDVFHYRMKMEHCFIDGRYADALAVGQRSEATDSTLTMLRAYALAREGQLGERLFNYPVAGHSASLVPMPSGTRCVIYPVDSLYRFLGARPLSTQTTRTYLEALVKGRKATPVVKDYILCGCLLDRDIDSFALLLPRFYRVDDNLPKHYREALTLYNHLRSNPVVAYRNNVMETDFNDLQTLEKQYATYGERKQAVFEQYAGTYWWYYEYGRR